ncbi:MAG: DUF4163 domain-containing protein [Lachnospiraceae bacterium]|nr:DUF4163 domain-containing protein [Lachnospiraceae bacterium]
MRKITLLISIVLLIALAGCGNSEKSDKSEPTNSVTEESNSTEEMTENNTQEVVEESTEEASEDTTQTTASEATGSFSSQTLPLELEATDNPRIMDLLNMSGSYTDSVGNEGTYRYKIPQFNAESDSAKALNKRIENDLSPLIENEIFNMEGGFSLTSYSIDYEVFEYGDIVAIVVTVPYDNDYKIYYAYTYDFDNDIELTNADLLAMNGMTEDGFVEEAVSLEEEEFMPMANQMGIDREEDINMYLEGAREATTAELPMYYDENGVLNVYVPIPSVAGASFYYQLRQF